MPLDRLEHNRLGLVAYRFDVPDSRSQPTFHHALLTRLGGVSRQPFASLNLGGGIGDDPSAVAENHHRVFTALDLLADQVVSPHQVHERRVAAVGLDDGGKIVPQTDALITNHPKIALLLRFADCVPVLLYDRERGAVGLAHAGWRGLAAGVIPATVSAMVSHYGTHPRDLWAGIGPSICADHYLVGQEVVRFIEATLPPGQPVAFRRDQTWHLDLSAAALGQLVTLGVESIDLSRICTACQRHEWYSHRAERGRTGRFGVIVMLA